MLSFGRRAVDIRRSDPQFRNWESADEIARGRNGLIGTGIALGFIAAVFGGAIRGIGGALLGKGRRLL